MDSHGLIYLDHNATTPQKPAVSEVIQYLSAFPGNASAIHKAGREARRLIEDSRNTLAKALNAGARDVIVFTAGATEANNMVLQRASVERVLMSAIEHPSVLGGSAAAPVEIIPVLPSGIIDLEALDKMLAGNTQQTLISVMLVNNETGVIQPVAEIVALARKYGALVHTDAVQAVGRMPFSVRESGVDFASISAHKIGGPQGTGALIIANCAVVAPQLTGGNQEKNLRAGTENLAGIAGMAAALRASDINAQAQLAAWRDRIEHDLRAAAPALRILGEKTPRVANTSMLALPGVSSETQLIALDLAGICVSNGSACSSGTVKASHVLAAMGADDATAQSSLRVSLGWNTTEEDIARFIAAWTKMYERVKDRCRK
jgi:cysteine desulfurase